MKVNFDKIITSVVYQPTHPEKCKTDRDYELFAKYMIVIQVLKGRYMKGSSTLEEIKDMAESCDSREGLEEFYKTLFLHDKFSQHVRRTVKLFRSIIKMVKNFLDIPGHV